MFYYCRNIFSTNINFYKFSINIKFMNMRIMLLKDYLELFLNRINYISSNLKHKYVIDE